MGPQFALRMLPGGYIETTSYEQSSMGPQFALRMLLTALEGAPLKHRFNGAAVCTADVTLA